MQCSVFQLMAFSGPINLYLTGISKHKQSHIKLSHIKPPQFTHLPVTSQLMEQLGNEKKTDKIVYSSFLDHALQLSCHGKLLPQSLSPVFGAQMSM